MQKKPRQEKPQPEPLGRMLYFGVLSVGVALGSIGALLCAFSTHWSIGFMVFVQLHYALAPGTWKRG